MNSKHIRADMNFAYLTAEIAAERAVNILYRGSNDRESKTPSAITAFAMLRNTREKTPPKQLGNIPL